MFACLYSPSAPLDDLARLARNFSPRIEIPDASMAVLDISGLGRLLGEPRVIGEELLHAMVTTAGLKPCATSTTSTTSTAGAVGSAGAVDTTRAAHIAVAIAGTRTAAQLLARHLPGLTVIAPEAEASAVGPLPLMTLAHVGAPPDLLVTLARWGLHTLREFAALPSDRLASRVGQHGLVWQRVARGLDARPLVPAVIDERFEALSDLEWPVEGLEPLAFVLGGLLEPLCARLALRDRAVAAIELRLRLAVSRTWRMRRIELPAPMRDARMLRTLLCLDLEGHPEVLRGAADHAECVERVDRLGVFIEPTPGRVLQFSLLARPDVTTMAPELLATLMARLRALMGQDRCGRARLVDTHRPDAFVMDDFRPTATGPSSSGVSERPPSAHPRALRRLRHPIPARVVVEQGRPARVTTDRRGWNGGRVTWCAGPWRTSGDWWRTEPTTAEQAYSWQEWDVSLSDGASYRIHEDRPRAHWFIDAILD